MSAVAIGLRAEKGGAVAVVVTLDDGVPRVLQSTSIATGDDRLSLAPYAAAAQMPRGADGRASAEAVAAVETGRKRQDRLAADGLAGLALSFGQATAVLLVNRAGWITDLLAYSLEWADHVPVAEGLAVRAALRAGASTAGLTLVEVDEKGLPEEAAAVLALPSDAVEARLKALGASAGKPWRKEQKLACLAAWITLAAAR